MNPFRQIADDTAHLIRDIRRGLTHLAWRASWWRRRRQVHAEQSAAETENLRRGASPAAKMCRECRALIPVNATTCPECGANTRRPRAAAAAGSTPRIPATLVLITAFFALFLAGVAISARVPAPPGEGPRSPLAAMMSLDREALRVTGANDGPLSGGPEPWRLLTAIFLHAGLLHLLFNAWALRVVGTLIEHLYGGRAMFVLFLVSGLLGNVASLWWHGPRLFQVGASGGIFGLIGVAATYGFLRRDATGEMLRRHMTEWILFGLVMGIFMNADNAAHIGGLLAGAAATFIAPDPHRVQGRLTSGTWGVLAFLGVLATIGSFALIVLRWAGPA